MLMVVFLSRFRHCYLDSALMEGFVVIDFSQTSKQAEKEGVCVCSIPWLCNYGVFFEVMRGN